MERWFLQEAQKLTRRRLARAQEAIGQALETGSAEGLAIPGRSDYWDLVQRYLEASWRWGRSHAATELRVESLAFNEPLPSGSRSPLPMEAVVWILARQALLGNWDRALDELVQKVVAESLLEGLTLRETVAALGLVLPTFSQPRLENIARTESSAAYTQGRIAEFLAPDSGVVAFQWSAIMDGRTTKICRDRDGLVLRVDDPRFRVNCPPLHYQCRTTIVPVTRAAWRRLERGEQRYLDRFFGWVPEGGPTTLEEALSRWDNVTPPLPGFGLAA